MKNNLISIGGRTKVNPNHVVVLVASVNYSLAYMHDGGVIVVATPLKELENRFRLHTFFRSHKSFLINLKFITDYDSENWLYAEMKNNLKATVSRRKRNDFRRLLFINNQL